MREKNFSKNFVNEVASRRACGIMLSCSSGTHVSKRGERGEKGEIEDEKGREREILTEFIIRVSRSSR